MCLMSMALLVGLATAYPMNDGLVAMTVLSFAVMAAGILVARMLGGL